MMPLAFVHDKDISMKDAVSAFLCKLLSILKDCKLGSLQSDHPGWACSK